MDNKNGKWAEQILKLQHDDGTWGLMFHSMIFNQSSIRQPLTTEQALFRLKVLGFDINDTPIRKAVDCMKACLRGERKIDDYWEKTHDWVLFTQLMLSTWVKIFDPYHDLSLAFSQLWAEIIEKAFTSGGYKSDDYVKAYVYQFNKKPRGAREIDFVDFYHISLLQGVITPKIESLLLDYVISKPDGIFYIYKKPLNKLPEVFASKESSHYLGALELLAGYGIAKEKLYFAIDWLNENRDENGQWDFGSKSNDSAYFPLLDSWKKAEDRKADCTKRVTAFLQRLSA
jgi:hypothetical protein